MRSSQVCREHLYTTTLSKSRSTSESCLSRLARWQLKAARARYCSSMQNHKAWDVIEL